MEIITATIKSKPKNIYIWNHDILKYFFDCQIAKLQSIGFITDELAEKIVNNRFSIIERIGSILVGKEAQIPFVIYPANGKSYCLIGINCNCALVEKTTQEAHRIITFQNMTFLTENETIIFEKIIHPLLRDLSAGTPFKNQYDFTENLVLKILWRNGTSYTHKIRIF